MTARGDRRAAQDQQSARRQDSEDEYDLPGAGGYLARYSSVGDGRGHEVGAGDREDQVVPRRRSLTSTLYRDARDRGNGAHQRRVVHKRVLKTSNGVVQRGLRKVGLWR